MATMSCERGDVERELIIRGQSYKQWLKETSCLRCPNNNHHDYPIMGGHITASICEACVYEAKAVFDVLPAGVSSSKEKLKERANELKERFAATFYSYQILEVGVVE